MRSLPEGVGNGEAGAARYDLTALGWLQFEGVCAELLGLFGVRPEAWVGEADSARSVAVPKAVAEALTGRSVAGPAVACVVWFPPWAATMWDARGRIAEAVGGAGTGDARTVIVLTNAVGNADLCAVAAGHLRAGADVVALGRAELGDLIDSRRDLWVTTPAVLGVRTLADLIPDDAGAAAFDLDAARSLAPTFVATSAYRRCCDVVARNGFAVLSGPPEMGKTATARMLGLVRLCQGWEVHECSDPDALWAAFRPGRRQMFIADDAFGSTEYRADAAERWARDLDRILQRTDEGHVLVWTSRPAPLHAALRRIHRENGLQRFPKPGDVMVDATDLTDAEKALMLFRHAVAADLAVGARSVIRRQAVAIVADPHLTPERIRRLVRGRLADFGGGFPGSATVADGIAYEIARPTEAMAVSLAALDPDHRDILVAMLDAPPAPVSERDLGLAARRHQQELAQPVSALVDRLQDHFLRRVPPAAVTWVHPSWRDLVIDQLERDPARRRAFLARCGIEGALLALSIAGGPAGERTLPFLIDDGDWDELLAHADALVAELDTAERVRLARQVSEAILDRSHHDDRRATAELDALAARLLETILPAPIDQTTLVLLSEWYALSELVREPPSPPDVAGVWIETVPTDELDLASREGVATLEAWTVLIGLLVRNDPAAVRRFGFPAGQDEVVGRLFARNAPVLAADITKDEALRLRRLARSLAWLFPDRQTALRAFSSYVFPYPPPRGEDETEDRPLIREPPRPTIVARVLADLDEPSPRRFRRGGRKPF